VAVLLAYGLTSNKSAHLIWAIPAACIAVLTAWFFSAGVYQDWFPFDLRRYFRYYWAQRVPVVLLISLVVGLLMSGSIKVRWLSSTLFAVVFLLALIVGEPLCSLSLPHVGTFAHGDYDTLGYRLGGYFLVATTLCLVPLQYFLFRPSHAQNEKSV
jgi:hypothetical protein